MMNLNGLGNLHTRAATLQDLPQIEGLIALSMRVLGGRDYSFEQIESALIYLVGADPHLIEDSTYTVAVIDGTIVAAGGWSMRQALYGRGDGDTSLEACRLNPKHDPARLRALFVHPNWSRRGLGRLLIQLAEYGARDHGFRSMELVATLTGLSLYEACGYRAIKPVEITLPDAVLFPGVMMRKSLLPGYAREALAVARQTATGLYPISR